jgi:dimethylargininase
MFGLVHIPTESLATGERTFVERQPVDLALARQQHAAYAATLSGWGVKVQCLDVNSQFPDAVFIEDTAVILDEVAICCRPGAASRQGEIAAIEPILRQWRDVVRVAPPATLEGGDVLRVGRRLWVGLSCRTNRAGVEFLRSWGRRLGYLVTPVAVRGCLHLKTACTALPDGRLWVHRPWLDAGTLGVDESHLVDVPPEEPWGANVLTVGEHVLAAAQSLGSIESLAARGYRVQGVDLSEFAKAEGGPTCLSLLIP